MNAAEHFFCSSALWRYISRRTLLPWVVSSTPLGDHVLELGAGYGAATVFLRQRASRVTSLEYDHRSARQLKLHHDGSPGRTVCGDASRLPFADRAFSSVVAILVLHHLESTEAQDQLFEEVLRVLRPGGKFLTFEIMDSRINRAIHFRTTFSPISPVSAVNRLTTAGFSEIAFDTRSGTFRLSAARPGRS